MSRSTSNRVLAWTFVLFAFWLLQAWTLGISDDEAYYWVLAQKPSLGYAYHPPVVAWAIAAFDGLPLLPRELKVRLPTILFGVLYWWIGASWVRRVRMERHRSETRHSDLAWLLLPGLVGAGWMAVPDLPLFAGWALCFAACAQPRMRWSSALLFAGALLGVLSKFSAVLYIASAAACIWIQAPRERRTLLLGSLALGALLGAVPTLYWNHLNDWASLRYQFLERHRSGGNLDSLRYLRFWATQLVLAGPALMVAMVLSWRKIDRSRWFTLAWFVPAAGVFWIQPAFSEFKPHWALVAWWPLALAAASLKDRPRWLDRLQMGWSMSIILIFSTLTQLPIQGALARWWTGRDPDPRMDVTNDLVGWKDLSSFIEQTLGPRGKTLPVTASRYQTAAQAAFALYPAGLVSLVPKSVAEAAEWPSLADAGVVEREVPGSGWPELVRPVLYVHDQRYNQPPAFPDAQCRELGVLSTRRWDLPAREVHLWRCDPRNGISGSF